jgi:hypothetical protein
MLKASLTALAARLLREVVAHLRKVQAGRAHSVRVVGNPEVKHLPWFEDRPPGPDDLSEVNPKSLKALVQKCGRSRGKFENRLLGPTNFPSDEWGSVNIPVHNSD